MKRRKETTLWVGKNRFSANYWQLFTRSPDPEYQGPTSEKLKHISGAVLNNHECHKFVPLRAEMFSDDLLCIHYGDGSACKGDSGVPLVTKPAWGDGVTPGQNYEQIGCNHTNWSVFARVTQVLDWIRDCVSTGPTFCPRE